MKKIKFRAWDKERRMMVYSDKTFPFNEYKFKIDTINGGELILTRLANQVNVTYNSDGTEDIINEFEKIDAIIMQYTGIKDINGVEIYEGDIIPHHFNENVKGIVKFGEYKSPCDNKFTKHQGFYIDFDGESRDYYRKDLGYWATMSNVMGNIYENQELL